MIFQAWEKVLQSTIQNCIRHTSFNNAIQQQAVQEEETSWPNMDNYVNFDNDVLISVIK